MNFLLFNENEVSADKSCAIISHDRLEDLKKRFIFKENQEINIGVVGGNRGKGILKKISDDSAMFDIDLSILPMKKKDIELVVSICRPQTNKKIIHIATSLGIKDVSFVRGENIPKSYIQSTSLSQENIKKECLLAMEQTGDTIFPNIEIYSSIYKYFNTKEFSRKCCVVADTQNLSEIEFRDFRDVDCIAIGPESGWTDKEVKYFHEKLFRSVSLGERILRVEIATTYLLGKIL